MADLGRDKARAKDFLLAADRHVKNGQFAKAREEVEKARKADPSNPYIVAFEERVKFFESQKPQQAPAQETPKLAEKTPPPGPRKPSAPLLQPDVPIPAVPETPAPVASPRTARTIPPLPPVAFPERVEPEVNEQILEMRRQLEELTQAISRERAAREEIEKRQLETRVHAFRIALEKSWKFGAPKAEEAQQLRAQAVSLGIPESVLASVTREVKLAMYGQAVRHVLAKRQVLRSSSRTLEWLRKVYQVSLSEYLEYESQFLMDLVSSQFRGTTLVVAADEKLKSVIIPRFKASGFAVVGAPNPETALEKADTLHPNVIVCDTRFDSGSLSAIKFLHILRANPKFNFVQFLMLCDAEDAKQLPQSDLRPNEAVVPKPVDIDDLCATMDRKLDEARRSISAL